MKTDGQGYLFVSRERREELAPWRDGEVERSRLVLGELEEVGVQLRLEGHVGRRLTVARPILHEAALLEEINAVTELITTVDSCRQFTIFTLTQILLYRDSLKGLCVVARIFFLFCLVLPGSRLAKYTSLLVHLRSGRKRLGKVNMIFSDIAPPGRHKIIAAKYQKSTFPESQTHTWSAEMTTSCVGL